MVELLEEKLDELDEDCLTDVIDCFTTLVDDDDVDDDAIDELDENEADCELLLLLRAPCCDDCTNSDILVCCC